MIPRELVRVLAAAIVVALPLLSLLVFGLVWLWQGGYVLLWSLLALGSAGLAWLMWPKRPAPSAAPRRQSDEAAAALPEPDWSPRDEAAWAKVRTLARQIEAAELTSQAALVAQARRTVDLVARHYHADAKDAPWRFTLIELLSLVERSAAGLRRTCREQVPLADQLRVSELRWLYGWTPAARWLRRVWDWWRVGRSAVNPVGALSAEIREHIVGELTSQGKEWVQRRLIQLFIEEVGRAAIDLYSGKLRTTREELAGRVSEATKRAELAEEMSEPLRIFVAGQTSVGKSSLVNALLGGVEAAVDVLPTSGGYREYRLEREESLLMQVVDAPAAALQPRNLETFLGKVWESDLVVWVCAADRADRAADRTGLEGMRAHFAERPERVPPRTLVVATHVDRLRPLREWAPPYDVQTPACAKANSIRQALDAISGDLDVPLGDIVPVRLDTPDNYYNVDVLWGCICEGLPEARKARLIRLRQDRDWDWRNVLVQARGAGQLVVRALRPPRRGE